MGLVFLMSILVFATYNDILRIVDQRRAKKDASAVEEKAASEKALKKTPEKAHKIPVKVQ